MSGSGTCHDKFVLDLDKRQQKLFGGFEASDRSSHVHQCLESSWNQVIIHTFDVSTGDFHLRGVSASKFVQGRN